MIFLVSAQILNFGCSTPGKDGNDGEDREFTKEFIVLDAQYSAVPGWLNEPQLWAKKHSDDHKKFSYFVSTTGLIKNKRLCTKSAEVQATSKIAAQLTQFIKGSYAQSVQGDADSEVDQYMEETLAQEIQSFLVGAQQRRSYWEKRRYKVSLGAEADRVGLICSSLVRMKKSTIKDAMKRAIKKLKGSASNPESKEKVEKALQDVSEKFDKLES